jgi:hypothetical protein
MELRKRKASTAPPPPPVKRKSTTKAPKAAAKVKEAAAKVTEKKEEPEEAKEEKKTEEEPKVEETKAEESKKTGGKPEVGDVVDLDGFGGEIETNDGEKTTLKKLVDESKSGVVLFTYPKASTPGCKLIKPSHPSIHLTLPQAPSKSASSATLMSLLPRTALPFTVSAPTPPRPTQPSRRSKSSLTHCCATPRQHSLRPSVSRRLLRERRAVFLSLARRARFWSLRLEAPRALLIAFRYWLKSWLANKDEASD